jgi:DNA ligase-1
MMRALTTPNKNVVLLEQELVTSQEVMDRWTNKAKELGWEGCMLRKDASYKRGRSKDLIKIKKFQDAEYTVNGIIEGTATYNENGAKEYPVVAALIIEHKGNQVKVGSGLSKEQRIGWLQNPNEIIGKTITVQYFEETQDSKTGEYSLRFPVLKYVYDDGRNV